MEADGCVREVTGENPALVTHTEGSSLHGVHYASTRPKSTPEWLRTDVGLSCVASIGLANGSLTQPRRGPGSPAAERRAACRN